MTPDLFHRDGSDDQRPEQFGFVSLTKGSTRAVCELWSHPAGWEIRLYAAGEFVQSMVSESEDEALECIERWKAAMLDKGWMA